MTDSGRTVYGGGGITPDEKYVAPKLNRFQTELLRKYAFFNFTRNVLRHARRQVAEGLDVRTTACSNEFHDSCSKRTSSSLKPSSRRTTTGSSAI